MDRPLFIAPGRQRFRKRGGPEAWGTPMPLLHESITEFRESTLVERVLREGHYRDTLFNVKGISAKGAEIRQQVQLRDYKRELAGDVDILIIPPDQPEFSAAIQVKRLKAVVTMNEDGSDNSFTGHPDRFSELMAKGILQANQTKEVGFSHVYLWVFVVIDTRARNSGWYTYEGPDPLLRSQISHAISPQGLTGTIGLMEFQWVQAMDRPPFELSSHGGHLTRLSEPTAQPPDLTAWLRGIAAH